LIDFGIVDGNILYAERQSDAEMTATEQKFDEAKHRLALTIALEDPSLAPITHDLLIDSVRIQSMSINSGFLLLYFLFFRESHCDSCVRR